MMHTRVPLPHVEARACRNLWSAVLLSVVRDLCKTGDRSRDRSEAERWIGGWPSRDFRTVCHLAGIEPDWLHGALLQLMALPVAERRHALAARLDCQPGQIGISLMVRQQSLENPESEAPETGRRAQKGGSAPISAGARRARIEAMFVQGLPPSDMPRMFAASGNAVSMGMIWNDIRHLRAKGRIGYVRHHGTPNPAAASGERS